MCCSYSGPRDTPADVAPIVTLRMHCFLHGAPAFLSVPLSMSGQVMALCRGRVGGCGVPAAYLSSQQSKAEAVCVFRELNKSTPTLKLL
jgi:hypothetical protein